MNKTIDYQIEEIHKLMFPDGFSVIYPETQVEEGYPIAQSINQLLLEYSKEQVMGELDKVMGGVNTAAGIKTPTAGARELNIEDLQYYLHNRKRVLQGKKAHTPQEWFEAVR